MNFEYFIGKYIFYFVKIIIMCYIIFFKEIWINVFIDMIEDYDNCI